MTRHFTSSRKIPGLRKPSTSAIEGGYPLKTRGEGVETFSTAKKMLRGPPHKRCGEEIYDLLNEWEECPRPGKKKKAPKPLLDVWKTRSVFWDLPYWPILGMPHCLDLMHITKNVFGSQSAFGLLGANKQICRPAETKVQRDEVS